MVFTDQCYIKNISADFEFFVQWSLNVQSSQTNITSIASLSILNFSLQKKFLCELSLQTVKLTERNSALILKICTCMTLGTPLSLFLDLHLLVSLWVSLMVSSLSSSFFLVYPFLSLCIWNESIIYIMSIITYNKEVRHLPLSKSLQ